jgi:hypothetical protein
MIKLFDGDDGQEQTGKGKPAAPSSFSIAPEPQSSPPARGGVAAASADGVVGAETPAVEEDVSYAGVEDPLSDPSPEPSPDDPALRPTENIVEKIQEEPAALRWDEAPGTEQNIPPQHGYEPEDPGPPPEAGPREYPPGFSENGPKPDVFVQAPYEPQSKADAIRGAGLAWSAGIIFFGSIVFMLILGWGADLLLGSTPWGIVGGIVLGSLIGFIQFFRISSQIFKK